MGDFTTNHTGDAHEWFLAASGPGGKSRPERDYYIWEDGSYVAWLGVPSLPKLNHLNAALRQRIFEHPQGVVRKWLGRCRRPRRLARRRRQHDGPLARHRRQPRRRTADARRHGPRRPRCAARGRALPRLHARHAGRRLARRDELRRLLQAGLDLAAAGPQGPPLPRRPGAAAAARRGSRSSTRCATSPRASPGSRSSTPSTSSARTTCRASARSSGLEGVEAAAGLLFTFPSMPMLTYGDEIGMEGTFGEDGRRPMPWDESDWDASTLEVYRGLIAARKGSVALRRGGLRWVHAEGDAMVFLRETEQEVALVHIARAAHAPVTPASRAPRGHRLPAHRHTDPLRRSARTLSRWAPTPRWSASGPGSPPTEGRGTHDEGGGDVRARLRDIADQAGRVGGDGVARAQRQARSRRDDPPGRADRARRARLRPAVSPAAQERRPRRPHRARADQPDLPGLRPDHRELARAERLHPGAVHAGGGGSARGRLRADAARARRRRHHLHLRPARRHDDRLRPLRRAARAGPAARARQRLHRGRRRPLHLQRRRRLDGPGARAPRQPGPHARSAWRSAPTATCRSSARSPASGTRCRS